MGSSDEEYDREVVELNRKYVQGKLGLSQSEAARLSPYEIQNVVDYRGREIAKIAQMYKSVALNRERLAKMTPTEREGYIARRNVGLATPEDRSSDRGMQLEARRRFLQQQKVPNLQPRQPTPFNIQEMQRTSVAPYKRESARETLSRAVTWADQRISEHLGRGEEMTSIVTGRKDTRPPGKVRDVTTGDSFGEIGREVYEEVKNRPFTSTAKGVAAYYGLKGGVAVVTAGTGGVRLGLKAAASKAKPTIVKKGLLATEKAVDPLTSLAFMEIAARDIVRAVKSGDKRRQAQTVAYLVGGAAVYRGGVRLGMRPIDVAVTRGRSSVPTESVIKDVPTLTGKTQFPFSKPGATPKTFIRTFQSTGGKATGYHASGEPLPSGAVIRGEIARPSDVPGLYVSPYAQGASPWFLRVGNEGGVGGYLSSVAAISGKVAKFEIGLIRNPKQYAKTVLDLISSKERLMQIRLMPKITKVSQAVLGEPIPLKPTIHEIEIAGGVTRKPGSKSLKEIQEFMMSPGAQKGKAYLTYRMEAALKQRQAGEAEAAISPGTKLVEVKTTQPIYIKYEGRRISVNKMVAQAEAAANVAAKTAIKNAVSTLDTIPTAPLKLYRPGIAVGLKAPRKVSTDTREGKTKKDGEKMGARAGTSNKPRASAKKRAASRGRPRARPRARGSGRERPRARERPRGRERDRPRERPEPRARPRERPRAMPRPRPRARPRPRPRPRARAQGTRRTIRTKTKRVLLTKPTASASVKTKSHASPKQTKTKRVSKNVLGTFESLFGGNKKTSPKKPKKRTGGEK